MATGIQILGGITIGPGWSIGAVWVIGGGGYDINTVQIAK